MTLEPIIFGAFQVWQLRLSEDGGARLMSATGSRESQESEMDYWAKELPDALLVYRTRAADGSIVEELHLDRTLATLPKPKGGRL